MKNKPAYILGRLAACYKTITGAEEIPVSPSISGFLFDKPFEAAKQMISEIDAATMPPLIEPMYDVVKDLAKTIGSYPISITELQTYLKGYETQNYMMEGLNEYDNET